jgi:hypothetical protein
MKFVRVVGIALTSCGQTTARRARACPAVTPGFGRAKTRSHQLPMFRRLACSGNTRGRIATGSVMSAVCPTLMPVNPGGLTPTIVTVTPSTASVRPMTSGRRPNARRQ